MLGKKKDPENGKAMTIPVVQLDDDTKRAIQAYQKDAESDATDQHKYSILDKLLDRTYAPFGAELDDGTIRQMDDIESHHRLIPLVWRRRLADGRMPPLVEECIELYKQHAQDHRVNTTAKSRKRESAIVYALKNDAGPGSMDRQVASFLRK